MTKKKEQQINIELEEKVGSGDYANFVVITHSPAELVMDFTRHLPGMPKAKVNSRIIMAPSHAKSFQKALSDNIEKLVQQYGEISIPQYDSFDKYGMNTPEDVLPN